MDDSDTEDSSAPSQQLKVVLLGDGSSGKTSIAARFSQSQFTKDYRQTAGVDFFLKRLSVGPHEVTLQVWDIGGQTLGGRMLDKYVYNCDIALLVYDVTNYESFANVSDWATSVRKFVEPSRKLHMGLVGNKVDLEPLRVVKLESHEKLCAELALSSHFTSARTGDSVTTLFFRAAAAFLGVQVKQADLEEHRAVVTAEIGEPVSGGRRVPPARSAGTNEVRTKACQIL